MNGSVVANGYSSLIGYLKDNHDIMDFLEGALGFKKKVAKAEATKPKEVEPTKTSETVSPPGKGT